MTAAGDSARLGKVEQDIAVLKQRADDQQRHVDTAMGLVVKQAVMEERLEGQQVAIGEGRDKAKEIYRRLDEHDRLAEDREREDRKKRWTQWTTLIGLAVACAGLVFTAVSVLGATH